MAQRKTRTLGKRILHMTHSEKPDLIAFCNDLLRQDRRLADLPLVTDKITHDDELHAVEPEDVTPYDDTLRAVCFLASSQRPASPSKCNKCGKSGKINVTLGYGGEHAGQWMAHCGVSLMNAIPLSFL